MKMEGRGEGNYASTAFLQGHQTDQGLTLSPKIPSNDTFHFDTAIPWCRGEADFGAFLDPLQLELLGEQTQTDDSWIHALAIHDDCQPFEPPSKRQRLAVDLPVEATSIALKSEPKRVNCHESKPAPEEVPNQFARLSVPFSEVVQSRVCICCRGTSSADSNSRLAPSATLYEREPVSRECSCCQVSHSEELRRGWINDLDSRGEDSQPAEFDDDSLQNVDSYEEKATKDVSNIDTASKHPWNYRISSRGISVEAHANCLPLNPDIPIPSIEKQRLEWMEKTTGKDSIAQVPGYMKMTEQDAAAFGVESGLFNLDCSHQEPSTTLDQTGNIHINRHHTPHTTGPDLHLRVPSQVLPLSLAIAFDNPSQLPSQQPSIAQLIADTSRLLPTVASPSSPSAEQHYVPADLRLTLEKLEDKFKNDKRFRASAVTYLVERLTTMAAGNAGDRASVSHLDPSKALEGLDLARTTDQIKKVCRSFDGPELAAASEKKALSARIAKLQDRIKKLEASVDNLQKERDYFKNKAQSTEHLINGTQVATPLVPGPDACLIGRAPRGHSESIIARPQMTCNGDALPRPNPVWQCNVKAWGKECGQCNGDFRWDKWGKWVPRDRCQKCKFATGKQHRTYIQEDDIGNLFEGPKRNSPSQSMPVIQLPMAASALFEPAALSPKFHGRPGFTIPNSASTPYPGKKLAGRQVVTATLAKRRHARGDNPAFMHPNAALTDSLGEDALSHPANLSILSPPYQRMEQQPKFSQKHQSNPPLSGLDHELIRYIIEPQLAASQTPLPTTHLSEGLSQNSLQSPVVEPNTVAVPEPQPHVSQVFRRPVFPSSRSSFQPHYVPAGVLTVPQVAPNDPVLQLASEDDSSPRVETPVMSTVSVQAHVGSSATKQESKKPHPISLPNIVLSPTQPAIANALLRTKLLSTQRTWMAPPAEQIDIISDVDSLFEDEKEGEPGMQLEMDQDFDRETLSDRERYVMELAMELESELEKGNSQ